MNKMPKLLGFEEIREYVATSPEFLARLGEASRKTLESGKEISLELQLDLTKLERGLSEVFIGEERVAAHVGNRTGGEYDECLTLLHLHSHPKRRVITPSNGDAASSFATASHNIFALTKYLEGEGHYPHVGEVFEFSKKFDWVYTNAIISASRRAVRMLLFQPPFLNLKSTKGKSYSNTQSGRIEYLEDTGCKVDFVRYSLGRNWNCKPE